MKISLRTIQALGKIITGDSNISPYRSGPQLVEFFNQHGGNSLYGQGFPSRWQFAEDQIRKLNDFKSIKELIEDAFDPRHYLNSNFDINNAVKFINEYLIYDSFEIVKKGLYYCVRNIDSKSAVTQNFADKLDTEKGSHLFILEQSEKCREKLESGDYDGAITNARSMVEAVFEEIITQGNVEIPKYDGDLNKLFKEVKKHLSLDSSQADLSETLKQVLSGLNSIVTGIAGIGNKMGDRHARKYKPEKHHALLANNTAYVLCEFLISSQEYQKTKLIKNKK
jgi:hypothetical protein